VSDFRHENELKLCDFFRYIFLLVLFFSANLYKIISWKAEETSTQVSCTKMWRFTRILMQKSKRKDKRNIWCVKVWQHVKWGHQQNCFN